MSETDPDVGDIVAHGNPIPPGSTRNLPIQILFEYFGYDPVTGKVFWIKLPRASKKKIGDVAGGITRRGYYRTSLRFGGRRYKMFCHNIAFVLFHGHWPANVVDHRDGNPSNNRIENLRDSTYVQQCQNRGRPKNNTSGVKGVSFSKAENKWHARIMVNKKDKHIGLFKTLEEAEAAYLSAAKLYFGEFMRVE